jgi:hypothetical protein
VNSGKVVARAGVGYEGCAWAGVSRSLNRANNNYINQIDTVLFGKYWRDIRQIMMFSCGNKATL